ncbi:hypothetical protein J7L60_04770 [Candidatus Bathyarchaeota archaeon]|nr:hypothetical protein [Candidatus Bathyarchaeota archaeon]
MGLSLCHDLREFRVSDWEGPSDLILVLCLDEGRVLEIREVPIAPGILERGTKAQAVATWG